MEFEPSPKSEFPAEFSVIYSFFAKWRSPLIRGQVGVFFRKRMPAATPSRIYFYIGAPVRALIGRADVLRKEPTARIDALRLKERGFISADELSSYIGNRDYIGAMHLGKVQIFAHEVTVDAMAHKLGISPPQNFQKLTLSDEDVIMRMAIHGT